MPKMKYCTNCDELIDWYNSPYIENDSGTCKCHFYVYEEYTDLTTVFSKEIELKAELHR